MLTDLSTLNKMVWRVMRLLLYHGIVDSQTLALKGVGAAAWRPQLGSHVWYQTPVSSQLLVLDFHKVMMMILQGW